jgi:hypothetical protein
MLNLPLVPFEFLLFSILLCYTAGMVSAFVIFSCSSSRIKRSYIAVAMVIRGGRSTTRCRGGTDG